MVLTNDRLIAYATLAIKDIALLAEKLPEDQLSKIFNVKGMRPFFAALFRTEMEDVKSHEEYLAWKNSKEIKGKRKRLLQMAQSVLDQLANEQLVHVLLPESIKSYFPLAREKADLLKFLLYAQTDE
jgi:hypothetical protein